MPPAFKLQVLKLDLEAGIATVGLSDGSRVVNASFPYHLAAGAITVEEAKAETIKRARELFGDAAQARL